MRHGVHLVLILFNELARKCVLLIDDAADLFVHSLHRALGNMCGLRHRAAQEHFAFVFRIDHRSHAFTHAVARHHVAGELSGAFKVVRRARRHLMHENFFSNSSAEENGNTSEQILTVIGIAVHLRELHGETERAAARNDRHLMHRVTFRQKPSNQGMTGFVIGRILLFVLAHHHGAAFRTHHDLVLGVFKVGHRHNAAVAASSEKRSFIDQVRKIGT